MPAKYTCDICGKEAEYKDYDGSILCEYHRAIADLEYAKEEYKEHSKWLKSTFLQTSRDMKDNIKRLTKKVKELEV